MDFFLILLFLFVGGGWLIGKIAGNVLFPKSDDEDYNFGSYKSQDTYIDNSVHNHFHVHDNTKSREIKELGKYADNLQDETIDVDYKDV